MISGCLAGRKPVKLGGAVLQIAAEGHNHAGVEELAGIARQVLKRLIGIHAWAVRPGADKGHKRVGDRHDARGDHDVITFYAVRHAGAVIAFLHLAQRGDHRAGEIDDRQNVGRGQDAVAHALAIRRLSKGRFW